MSDRIKHWQVIVKERVSKKVGRLPQPERERIVAEIKRLQAGPYQQGIKNLHERPEWRLEVSGRRILFEVRWDTQTIVVKEIGPRVGTCTNEFGGYACGRPSVCDECRIRQDARLQRFEGAPLGRAGTNSWGHQAGA